MSTRPPFIISSADLPEDAADGYPGSSEKLSHGRKIGQVAGLLRIGLHLERVPPGRRVSYPHAEENEEEFVFVLEGEIDAWVDGHIHHMNKGDLAAFPAGTGITHTFLNDGDEDCLLLIGGEASRRENKITYPMDPQRRADIPWSRWWEDAPKRELGPHDGKPKPR